MNMHMSLKLLTMLKEYGDSSPYSEVIAVLLGKKHSEYYALEYFNGVKNVADTPDILYCPDQQEFYDILKTTTAFDAKAGIDFLGIYHTHPMNEAVPSFTDIHSAAYPGIYLIYSPLYQDIKAYWNVGLTPFNAKLQTDVKECAFKLDGSIGFERSNIII